MAKLDLTFDKGMPSDVQAERLLLGLVLLDYRQYWRVLEGAPSDIFSLEKHRRIHARMLDLAETSTAIDITTLADALRKSGHLESIGGLSAIMDLTDGIPDLPNPESWLNILYDKYTLRRIILQGQAIINRALIAEEDAAAVALAMENAARDLQKIHGSERGGRQPGRIVAEFPGGINSFLDPSSRVQGLQTGFTRLDEMTSGLHGGELIILAARPGMGKSALAMNIAQNLVMRSKPTPVAMFSLEMSASNLLERALCSAALVDAHRFRLGYLNQNERASLHRALSNLMDAPLFIDDTAGATLPDISRKLRHHVERDGVGLGIIDYLGLMAGGKRQAENRNQEVSVISRGLKLLAKDLNIPIIALNQLSRTTETRAGGNGVPQLSDLRDSGSLEQDADMVWFIYREEVYKRDREDLKGLADVIIAKQRNGPIGKVPLRFIGRLTRFENRADEAEQKED